MSSHGADEKLSINELLLSDNNTTVDIHTYLMDMRATSRSGTENAFLIIAYTIIVVVSFFGNLLVCYVIWKNKRLHTVTNIFIANLAVADILMTIWNIPFNLVRIVLEQWPFGQAMCVVVNMALMVSVYVSTFTLTAIALDRYQVIIKPLRPRMSNNGGLFGTAMIWTLAILLSLPYGLYSQDEEVSFIVSRVRRCRLLFPAPSDVIEKYISLATIMAQYVIPLTIIAVTYGRIVQKLWSREALGDITPEQQLKHCQIKLKTIKMLILVVILFALCWMPLNMYHVLTDFHPDRKTFRHDTTVFFVCHWIAMSSICYNPFVYCWLNESFRAEFKSRCNLVLKRSGRIHPGVEVEGGLVREDMVDKTRGHRWFHSITTRTSSSRRGSPAENIILAGQNHTPTYTQDHNNTCTIK